MKQLEFLFLAALISGIASYASSQMRKRKALLLTRKNLFRATGILLSALTMLLIGCALMALIHLCAQYGRIDAAAEAISDAIIAVIMVAPLIWKVLFCVKPVWQGCAMAGFDELRDQTLVYNGAFWHYHDSDWYISVGVGTAIAIRRSAIDSNRAAVIIGETLKMGKSSRNYNVLMLLLKNGKSYRAFIGKDERFLDWLRIYGIKIK